ncbi:MAG TPA: hypothetical protein VFP81_02875 [Propionibacteriaceae bacterium]|nr:hypothetical protein [Propionibacteriaceae bacterium]
MIMARSLSGNDLVDRGSSLLPRGKILLAVEVMIASARRPMFDRVAECGTRHRCGVAIEKVSQARLVPLASFSNPATNRLLDQVFGVVRENLSDAEGVI